MQNQLKPKSATKVDIQSDGAVGLKAMAWIIIWVTSMIVLFVGEPSLLNAIITRVGGCP